MLRAWRMMTTVPSQGDDAIKIHSLSKLLAVIWRDSLVSLWD